MLSCYGEAGRGIIPAARKAQGWVCYPTVWPRGPGYYEECARELFSCKEHRVGYAIPLCGQEGLVTLKNVPESCFPAKNTGLGMLSRYGEAGFGMLSCCWKSTGLGMLSHCVA